jgi:vancomycin resistance protein YoaR
MAKPVAQPKGNASPIAFALITGACVAAISALGATTFWHLYSAPSEKVRSGFVVADVSVGGVSRDEVRQVVRQRLERYANTQITLKVPGGARPVTAGELGYRPELAATLAQLEALGVQPQREAMLAEWTGESRPQSIAPTFSIDAASQASAIEPIARTIDQAAVDADVRVNPDTSVEVIPAKAGRRVNREELSRRLQAAFRGLETDVTVPVEPVAPAISDAAAAAAGKQAEQFVAAPLQVSAAGRNWTLSRGDLASWVVFVKAPDTTEKVRFELHPDRPRNWLTDRADELVKPARDARFRLKGGKLSVTTPEESGSQIDVVAALATLKAGAAKPEHRVELPVKTLAPRVGADQATKLTFPDLIAEAATVYGGGIPERSHNVELAAQRVDGVVVPPGASFSFNQSIGRTRLKDGYQVAFGIQADPDGVQTVPSVAGGICQVSTTLFHAAFWAGLQIDERHEHPYWIPKYGVPPKGMTGLDTTVDEDSGLDFRFKNTTNAPLLIQASTDGNRVTFQLHGTKPGWEVTTTGPSLSSFVKADPTFVRQEDATLAAGRALQVEEARDGFDSLVTRKVTKAGTVLDELEVRSHYAPSRNVILVGTRR